MSKNILTYLPKHIKKLEDQYLGQRFTRLVIVGFKKYPDKKQYFAICKCDCGNVTESTMSPLRLGQTKSCGCYLSDVLKSKLGKAKPRGQEASNANIQELNDKYLDKKYHHLTIIECIPGCVQNGKRIRTKAKCQCDCGTIKIIFLNAILNKGQKSCGCMQNPSGENAPNYKHGQSPGNGPDTPEYQAYHRMHDRCYNPNSPDFKYYGGRTDRPIIYVCERWHRDNPDGLKNFLNDMGKRPSDDYSIDRIENDFPYRPDNCRWALDTTQNNNQRKPPRIPIVCEKCKKQTTVTKTHFLAYGSYCGDPCYKRKK